MCDRVCAQARARKACAVSTCAALAATSLAQGVATDRSSFPILQTEDGTSSTAGPVAVGEERARLFFRESDVPTTAFGELGVGIEHVP